MIIFYRKSATFTNIVVGLTAFVILGLHSGLWAQTFPTPGFTLPAGKTITITYEVDVNANACPTGLASSTNITNQSNVSGSNFATVQTTQTLTPFSTLSIGDRVYKDVNKNGVYDSGIDQGVGNVIVNLYMDNGDGVLTAADGLLATNNTLATPAAALGFYNFPNLCPGNYIVQVAPSNFLPGGALYDNTLMAGLISSPVGGAPDPDNDVDNDDNGDPVAGLGVASQAITLAYGTEPITDGDGDNNTNYTLDFLFKTPTTVSITSSVALAEGTGGGPTAFNFTVTRSDDSQTFNLTVNTSGGTATSGTDYAAISGGTVSFTAGNSDLTETITVNVAHDNIVEDNETFNVVLSGGPPEVIITGATGEGTINNDDTATLTFSGGNSESESSTSRTFTATLSAPVQGGFKANYYITDGSATAADDFTGSNGALTFVGTTNEPQSLTVTVTNDNKVELNENFTVNLAPATADITMTSSVQANAITVVNVTQTETITNDDAATVTLAPISATANEGNAGTTNRTFSVTLDNPVDGGFTLAYVTNDGTATTADNDYVDNDNSINFAGTAGESKIITVQVNGDTKVEANETFSVDVATLFGGPNLASVSVAGAPQTGTITNDDAATVTLSAAASPLQHPEGNTGTTDFVFTATLDNPVQGGITVAYTTSDGLAVTPEDYVDNDGTLTFTGTAGETKNITIQAKGDLKVEANESFFVNLGAISGAPAGVTTAGSPQQGQIVNDELDWGDAPDTYNTLSANTGARHNTSILFHLGATVDGDLDGQPTAAGDGDDTDAEGDDDDGVTLPAAFITGTTASITVNASGAGFLNAWVDFNNDGDWNETGEQIFNNVTLVTGNNALSFAVPAGATPSTTFARFRYTTATVTTPAFTGLQTTGEVEDYQVNILDNQYNISSPTVAEGNAGTANLTFAVSRTNGTGTGSVDYSVPTGTATSGTDYNALMAGTVNFANGETSKNLTVTVNGDLVVEDNETVILTLSNPVNGAIATGTGTGIITNDDNATLTLSGGISQNEGNAGSTVYTFTATLSAPVQGGFQVAYTTGGGTATAGTDYTDNDASLTFAGNAGETKSWTVNVSGDNTVELNETFQGILGSITMTSAVQAAAIGLSGSPQTATITNDDQAVISFPTPFNVTEGNSGTQSYTISFNLSKPVDVDLSFSYTHTNGTATTADNDYISDIGGFTELAGGSGNIVPGSLSIINGDTKVEGNETFNLVLFENNFQGRNVVFQGGGTSLSNTITINNDDNATVTLTGGSSANEGNSGTNNRTFTATLNNPVQGGFTVAYTTNNGTATTADNDYVDNDGTLTFTGTANEPQSITVQVNGDLNIEADETFTVQLGSITAATTVQTNAISIGGTNPQTANILNDELDWGDAPDSYLTLLTSNGARHTAAPGGLRLGATIDADLDGQPNANATGDGSDEDGVSLPPVLVLNTTANLTVNASATGKLDAWVDFNNDGSFTDPGEKVFNNVAVVAGNNSLSFAVPNGATPSNTFARFRLSSAGGLTPTGLAADGEVEDYAIQIVNTQFSISDKTITEGNAGTTNLTFTISRTVNANACSVNYAITGGTAASGSDYQPFTNGTVNFTAGGDFSQTITVVVTGDNTVELDETVLMTLSMPVNGAILDGSGIGTITNDDAAVISISNPSISEGTSGTVNLTFDITMNNPSDANVVVNYATVDGTATTADNDYQANSASLTFTPGQTAKQVTVIVNGDCKVEPNETLLLRLSSLNNDSRNVTLSGGGATLDGTGTIQNTPLPTASISGTTAVCQNAPSPNITFTGSGGTAPYTFTYKINNGSDLTVTTSSMSNTITVSVPTNSAGNFVYTLVRVSDVHCGQNQSGSATVTVNPLPTASIAGTIAVCQNSTAPNITFTGANATAPYTFTYKINNGPDLTVTSVGNTATVSVPTASAGSFVYTLVSVKDASSTQCSQNQSGSATVTVNPLPTASISGTTQVCQNSTAPNITFTGANATAPYTFTYKINNGPDLTVTSVGNTATVSVPTASVGGFVYTLVSVKDGSSTQCSQNQSGSATVTVNPLPTASIAGTIAVCQNSTAPNITFTGANATAPYTFTYKINNGPDLTVTSVGNIATVSVPTTSAGSFVYTLVSVKDASSTQCSQNQSGSATVTVNPLPTASISGTTQVCQNAPFPQITFTGSGGTAPYTFTYKINGGADLTVTTTSGNSVSVNQTTANAGDFEYTLVSVKDASSTQCSQSQNGSATITVHALPVVSTPQTALCTGLTMTLSPTSGGTWQSSNPAMASVNNAGLVTGMAPGVVSFTFTQTSTGCSAATANVTIKPTPTSNLSASKYDVCPNTLVTLTPNCSIPTSAVNWNPGGPTVTPDAATIPYVYRARCVADGCVGNETSVEVRTHRILVDMKDLDVGPLPKAIVRSVKDNMEPTNLINAPAFPRRWTFIATGCDASEAAVFKLSGPVNFNTIDNAATYAMFANDAGGFYSIDHPNYGNGGSFPNGTYSLTIDLRSQDGVGGPFPKNRVAVGSVLATRTLQFTVGSPSVRQGVSESTVPSLGSEPWAQISPNPVSNIMRLKVSDAKGEKVNVNLLDASGRTMLQRSFVPDTNQHQEEFEVGEVTNGLYFLRVNTENKNATLKVVKVE